MFAATGPSISADGLQATADLSGPSTASQPQAQSAEYQSALAAIQSANPNQPLPPQDRLETLSLATPVNGQASSSNAPSPTATSTPVPDCVPSSSGLYCVYTVKAGDTLSAIASRYGLKSSGDLSPAEMLAQSNKPAVVESNSIETGLKLRIPAENGIIHTAFSGETLSAVAAIYGVDTAAIEAANSIGASGLVAGQNILVPDPQRITLPSAPAAAAAAPEPTPAADEDEAEESAALAAAEEEAEETADTAAAEEEAETPAAETPTEEAAAAAPADTPTAVPPSATPQPAPSATPASRRATATPTPKPAGSGSSAGFIWPAQGPISSYFGPSHPLGIDIDFYANPNQAVVAVAGGTVTFAGGDACCSYGYYVIVDHGNGFQTLYAHFSRFASGISTGTKVSQGQVLGYGGQTGYATGYHLHFEVHYNGAIVNPLNYLP